MPERNAAGYRIGTVAHLTGLDPHTIRAWERRHQAIEPSRSEGGTRLYSDEDVARLQLIKAVVDCGDAIGTVARLSNRALRARLAKVTGAPSSPGPRSVGREGRSGRVVVVSGELDAQIRANSIGIEPLEVVASVAEAGDLPPKKRLGSVDILLVELPALGDDPTAGLEALVDRSGARLAIVVYRFARRSELEQLAAGGARLLRAPVGVAQLRQSILDLAVIHGSEPKPARRAAPPVPARGATPPARVFDDVQLARLREIRSSVDCECPNHLSALIEMLNAFEGYSRHCEERDPGDAELHARLALGTARARAVVEQLLVEVCERDHIRL